MILQDRVAIVTGAGSGIGREGARAMAREGAIVIVADRDAGSAASVVAAIVGDGGRAEAVAMDVGNDAEIAELVEKAVVRHGHLDILHNHAGLQISGPLTEIEPDGMDASWRINVRAHFMTARHVIPCMIRQGGGVILNTASNSGVFFDREMIAYTTTKHAVVAMTKQMAVDYARHNIRVNALCPGWVDTPFNDPFIAQMGGRDAIQAYVRIRIPMGRWGRADEIAEAILFLVSDRASFITGHALVIDGGESIA